MPPDPPNAGAAITGIGVLSCLGRGFEAHRRALVERRSALGPSRRVDAPDLGYSPVGEVDEAWLEPDGAQRPRVLRLARVAALDALEGARLKGRGVLVVGTTTGSIFESEQHYLRARQTGGEPLWHMRHHPVGELALEIAASLALDAECHTFVTACSSSSNAIGYGALRVALGAPWALVGGVDTLCLMTYAGFHALRLLSRGPPRPFDRARSGVAVAEGAGFLLLERHDTPRRAWGELRGWGCTVDAFHQTAPDPHGTGAVAAMHAALEDAGARPAEVGYVNAHGTATPANDRVESLALNTFFSSSRPWVSSTKGLTGHTLGAAGVIEAVLCLAALAEGRAPPSVGLDQPDADCGVRHVPREGAPLPSPWVMSNSFGFGGNNASLVLRGAGAPAAEPRALPRGLQRTAEARAYIHGMGFAAPGAVGVAALAQRLGAAASAFVGPLELPELADKRLARLERIAIAAAREALGDAPREGTALIVGTAYGRLDAAGDFLEGLARRGVQHGSPFAFYQSVYHSLAGQLGIHLGMRGLGLTTSAREISGESALQVGLDLIAARKAERVLVVAADDAAPALRDVLPPEHPARVGQPEGAVTGAAALLLSARPSAAAVRFCELARHAVAPGALPAARDTQPLLALARVAAGPDALEPSDDPVRFGLHAVGGLMRAVAAIVRLRERGGSALIHTVGLGGVQAATVLSATRGVDAG